MCEGIELDYENLWLEAQRQGRLKAEAIYPPGREREADAQEQAARIYYFMITPPTRRERCPRCGF